MPLPMVQNTQAELKTQIPEDKSAEEKRARAKKVRSTSYKTQRRFDRAARLFGEASLKRLMDAHVAVIGVGGVGSFAAESLARSGVGQLTLVDYDAVCITNSNRQLHTMKGTIGRPKVEVMAERLRLVHPTATITAAPEFYSEQNSDSIFARGPFDYVIDAIDNITAKVHLLAACYKRDIPVVSSMGAAARLDPTQIQVADIAMTTKDPFAKAVRKFLRKHHGIMATERTPIGIPAVFSTEPSLLPIPLSYDEGTGFVCVCPGGKNGLNDCDKKNRIDGSASFVTGAFGLTAASVVVRHFVDRDAPFVVD